MNADRHNLWARCACALALGITLLLGACGGGGDDGSAAQQKPQSVGATGGTVIGANGAQVSIPPGALASDMAIEITQSSMGATPLPGGFVPFGAMFAFTPHGAAFATPVTVTVPFDPAMLPAGATPVLYKTDSQGAWQRIDGAVVGAGVVSAQVTSFSFFLVGNLPPQITQQPQDASVAEPNTATFSVTALGTPPFSYQWQRSDDGGVTFGDVGSGARFTTPATSAANDNGDRYRVIVSNLEGSSTSQAALLTVTTSTIAPVITSHPQNVTIAAGLDATFSVVAGGTSPRYQWQRSNDGGSTFADIAGATNASYTLVNAQAADHNARFRARVSNAAGSVVSNVATLSVGAASTPPPTQGRFTLTVSVSGNFGEVWGFRPNAVVPNLQCINSPGGPNPCSEPYAAGTRVTLVPQTFTGTVVWTGCDEDRGNTGCIVNMNADRTVTARFQ